MTLVKHLNNLFELYGNRNAMYMRGDMRAMFLHNAVRTLSKLIRNKTQNKDILAASLASIFARTAAFADSFVNLPVIEALCEKYPSMYCAYCTHSPCICEVDRKQEVTLASVSPAQMAWPVKEWVYHIKVMYGQNNREQGIYFVLVRFTEEMHEAESAHLFDDPSNPKINLTERRQMIAREFADVFAWIFALADILELDLDRELEHRYGGSCHRCGCRPCNCVSPLALERRANPIRGPHTTTLE
jgi:NTP pyrophosphatase (non-canonical NTP hydrolase)